MPKKVDLKQNSKDWHSWRKRGIGASEAGAVMGASEWDTRFELWAYKTGLLPKPEFNGFAQMAVDRGTKLEPEARAYFEGVLKLEFPAVSYEHEQYPFIRASLDGHNEQANESLEIKCPGKESFKKALKKEVPDNYYAQMQQQMLVSGAKKTHYGVYYKESGAMVGTGVLIQVEANVDYQTRLLSSLIEFWGLVTTKTPPPVDATDLSRLVARLQGDFLKLQASVNALNILNQAFTMGHFSIKGE
jgi:putative phage-type endonuclease